MRGLRFPLWGYALPAVSPCKTKHERRLRIRQFGSGGPASAQSNHAVHHVARSGGCQCAKIQLLVLLKLCVDPDTRTIPDIFSSFIRKGERRWPYGNSEERFARAGFMLQLGWRSMSLMLFLAPGASGPEVAKEIRGGEAGLQRAGQPTKSRD